MASYARAQQAQSQNTQANPDVWTVKAALDWTVGYLSQKGDEHPRLSAEWLLADATGLSRVGVYAYFDRPLSADERAILRKTVARRAAGEPLQYVSGETAFRHLIVKAEPGVLIPRPETETLVELALGLLSEKVAPHETARVLEVGTGTGCIALSLALERPHTQVVATDISPEAIALSTRNRDALELQDAVTIVECDLASGIDPLLIGTFDLLISNPPYIPTPLMAALPNEVSAFEPHLALDGGADGLDVFRRLVNEGRTLLKPGGILAVELHENTLRQAADACVEYYEEVKVHTDLTGRERFLTARRTQS